MKNKLEHTRLKCKSLVYSNSSYLAALTSSSKSSIFVDVKCRAKSALQQTAEQKRTNENGRSAVEFDCVCISLARNNVPKTCRRQHQTWRRHNFTRLERKVLVFFSWAGTFFYHLISAHSSKFNFTVCRHMYMKGCHVAHQQLNYVFRDFIFLWRFCISPASVRACSTRCLTLGSFYLLLLRFAFLIDIRYC